VTFSRTSSFLAFFIRALCGCTVRRFPVHEFDRPVVFYSNHTSNLDFPVIWSALPKALRRKVRPLAAHDYWSKGKLRVFLASEIFKAILIERKAVTRKNNPLMQMEAALAESSSLIIFPEGTRSTCGEIAPFKPGIYHLAQADKELPFIPVHLENLFRILPKGEIFPLPLVAILRFGDPLYYREGESKTDFIERARQALEGLKAVDQPTGQ
jgi:1-acyl-sn-glycerol-3-phosphate acyltransferase